jgi:hypothetical protein
MPELTKPVEDKTAPAGKEDKSALVTKADEYNCTFEEAKARISKDNSISVGLQDPVLCVVTINNLYLEHLNKLMNGHANALKGFMGASAEGMAQAFDSKIEAFADALKKSALENVMAEIVAHQKSMDSFREEIRVLTANVKPYCLAALGASIIVLLVVITRFARGML